MSSQDTYTLFLCLAVLLGSARLLGELATGFGQPAIIGEIIAGILLGPTVLGRISPEISALLFPRQGMLPVVLTGITTLAIALFLLVAGMEVELSRLWKQGRLATQVGLAGILFPFAIALSAAWFFPLQLGCEKSANQGVFAFFFATAMSISALPVIAKTLMDLKLLHTDFGMVVIASAVFNDLVGWMIFAVILGMMGTADNPVSPPMTIALTIGFAIGILTLGRWLIDRSLPFVLKSTSHPGGVLGYATVLALLAAAFTEWIGVHAIFGSFLIGVAIGDSKHLTQSVRDTITQFISYIFAPLFFATIGIRIDFLEKFDLSIIVSVLVIACVGKIVGCSLAARWNGMSRGASLSVGFALNARGAMEIILGLLALNNGLIRNRMFVALVIMALVTSLMSGPAIRRLGVEK
jgi:Kef-type K+ transport system membrane component KefB